LLALAHGARNYVASLLFSFSLIFQKGPNVLAKARRFITANKKTNNNPNNNNKTT
jgi:hypothetical protein